MDLPWQQPNKAELSSAMSIGRLPHALLLSGYPGWGATELGNWLALQVLEHRRAVDARQLAHPDFRWVAPERGLIAVDQIRRLHEFSQRVPQLVPAKAAVVEDADCMNVNAANALLKSLEEPPGNTYLILTSHRAGALLPTIRSRCQTVAIRRDVAVAQAWLQDNAAGALLEDYDGAPLLAMAGAADGERPMATVLPELAGAGSAQAVQLIEELLGLNPIRLTARWARCLVSAMAGQGPALGVGVNRRTFAFIDELMWCHLQFSLSSSANVRLLMERLCHRWRGLAT